MLTQDYNSWLLVLIITANYFKNKLTKLTTILTTNIKLYTMSAMILFVYDQFFILNAVVHRNSVKVLKCNKNKILWKLGIEKKYAFKTLRNVFDQRLDNLKRLTEKMLKQTHISN